MFVKTAEFYDALYSWKDYAAEVVKLHGLVQRFRPGASTLLDVACGTGKHLELLTQHYEVEGVDLDGNLLEIARKRNPDVDLHLGDMVDFDLGRTYDAVLCLFSSIGYVQTTSHLDRTTVSLARHLAPGGVLMIEPWLAPDAFEEGHVGLLVVDEPDLKITRMNSSLRAGEVSILDFHYLVGTPDGIQHLTETHHLGLFSEADHLEAMKRAGLDPQASEDLGMGRGLYIGLKPA